MKMIIVGAGATAYSYHANPKRRPPLSNAGDFTRMFENPVIVRPVIESHYKPFFIEAIKLYGGDLESLFTGIYMLKKFKLFSQEELQDDKLETLKSICSRLGNTRYAVTYSNILTIFQGVLFDEIRSCIGTTEDVPIMPLEMPICPWHRYLSRTLSYNDVVVNFNYDGIMSYALLNEKKLSRKSFINSHIKEVDIQPHLLSDSPVTLINPHGSFTWYQDISPKNYWDGKQFNFTKEYFEVSKECKSYLDNGRRIPEEVVIAANRKSYPICIAVGLNRYPLKGDYSYAPVILPLKKKRQIFEEFPQFEEEYSLFLNKLSGADEIYLIGKQFKNSDEDIAGDIERVCRYSKQKHLILVDPQSNCNEWVEYHCKIFNSKSHTCFTSLKNYVLQ